MSKTTDHPPRAVVEMNCFYCGKEILVGDPVVEEQCCIDGKANLKRWYKEKYLYMHTDQK